ncbi:MAG: hypothetical protein ACJAT3_001235 [Akkermansiaceae bacterium]
MAETSDSSIGSSLGSRCKFSKSILFLRKQIIPTFRKNCEMSPEKVPKTKKNINGCAKAGIHMSAAIPK